MSNPNKHPTPPNPNFRTINLLLTGLVGALELGSEQQKRAGELEEKAMLDPLTGLHNRRYLEEIYKKLQHKTPRKREFDTTPQQPQSHSLILFDLDGFKQINDTLGHQAGDEKLKGFASILQTRTRDRDITVRFGGDEFAALLPRTDEAQAALVASDILELANAAHTKVSIGVAEVDLHNSLEQNLVQVDEALYESKRGGRNQVTRFEDVANGLGQSITRRPI